MTNLYFQKILCSVLFCFAISIGQAQTYVKQDASGANDGSSWENAFTDLNDALSSSPDEVWVAAGTYLPSDTPGDTSATFAITNSLSLYGGFNGTETSFSERNPVANPTILSGDLAGDDQPGDFFANREDNVRHVVYVDSLLSGVTIDGFTISNGQTNDFADSEYFTRAGGGLYGVSPVNLMSCTFRANFGRSGGAVLLRDGAHSSIVENCTFIDNMTSSQGAGIHTVSLDGVTIKDCDFTENFTNRGAYYPIRCTNLLVEGCEFTSNFNDGGFGGAMFCWNNENFTIRDCNFESNEAANAAGIHIDGRELTDNNVENVVIENCEFYENVAGGFGGGGIRTFAASYTVDNCFFDGNISGSGGHIFNFGDGENVTIKNSEFYNAQGSGWGGAATAYGVDANFLFESCIFEGNTTAELGGAANVGFAAIATFDNCEFEDNTSVGSAGGALALQNDSSTIIVLNSTFTNNESMNSGGAIAATTTQSSSSIIVDNCNFLVNTCSDGFGGAINISENGDDDISELTISNSFFGFNSANDQGGAINMNDANTNITSSVFFSNFCQGAGRGTLAFNASDSNSVEVTLLHTTMSENSGAFSAGLSQWTGLDNAELNTSIQNCLFQSGGLTNFAIEDGDPQLNSNGGNLFDDASAASFLTEPSDLNETETEFVDPDDFDYTPTSNSPAIDAGVADGAPATDIFGNPRINFPDIGAFENQEIVKVNEALLENNGMLQIFPNPVRAFHTNVSLDNDWRGAIEIRVTDANGKLVRHFELDKASQLFEFKMPLNDFNTGVYQVAISNGEAVVVERLLRI